MQLVHEHKAGNGEKTNSKSDSYRKQGVNLAHSQCMNEGDLHTVSSTPPSCPELTA